MQRTRTAVRVLAGVAVAALSGCVSVEARPPVPEPSGRTGHGVREAARQIVEEPAREALEAALPPPPSTPPAPAPRASRRPRAATPEWREPGTGAAKGEPGRPDTLPGRPGRPGTPDIAQPPRKPPRSLADVCELGERYGGWRPDSDQTRICRGTYGR
ncbi:hypothetical protein [Streptomyces sp. NPDC048577]|uniref:hypothetical protein n=1 Tax=Streptomyces sp. NPDC048577 TaxID=3157209 RepID=UPI003447C604